MHKLPAFLLSLLCVLSITGCINTAALESGVSENVGQLSSLPVEAELVYSFTSDSVYGSGITTDAWSHSEDTGFFVVELLCDSGIIRQMELRKATGEVVASFGNVHKNGIFITDIVIEAADDYTLYFNEANYFAGEINVYFVSGIGYSTAD